MHMLYLVRKHINLNTWFGRNQPKLNNYEIMIKGIEYNHDDQTH